MARTSSLPRPRGRVLAVFPFARHASRETTMRSPWITDMTHFLDSTGRVPARARPIVTFLGSIVSGTSILNPGDPCVLALNCRRRPGRRPCTGRIRSWIEASTGEIQWHCPVCGDHGSISNWEDSPWDLRSPQPDRSGAPAGGLLGFTKPAIRAWERVPPGNRLRLLNNVWCGKCLDGTSIALAGGFVEDGDLVLRGSCTKCGGSVARVIEEAGRE
jgi:hypothetical protein